MIGDVRLSYVPTAPPLAAPPLAAPLLTAPAPLLLPPTRHQPGRVGADSAARGTEVAPTARHLTVVCGTTSHDVVVDPALEVGALLDAVLGDELVDAIGDVSPALARVATTPMGRVLADGDSIERAGLVDGSVIVAVLLLAADIDAATSPPGPITQTGQTAQTAATRGDRARRGRRPGGRPTDGLAVKVAGCCGVGLSLFALTVEGLPRVGVPPAGASVLALALAAAMSRVVPDLVVRLPAATGSGSPGMIDGSVHDAASVDAWVRLAAGRQLGAHLAVLVVVLVAAGVLLAASVGMPVGALGRGLAAAGVDPNAPPLWSGSTSLAIPLSWPILMSLVASAMTLGGSARGRGRSDRWFLRAASAAALLPAVSFLAALPPTPFAVITAYGFVGLGLLAMRPARGRRRPGLTRSRLARGVDVVAVIATLPLGCWASGLLSGVQAWAHTLLS